MNAFIIRITQCFAYQVLRCQHFSLKASRLGSTPNKICSSPFSTSSWTMTSSSQMQNVRLRSTTTKSWRQTAATFSVRYHNMSIIGNNLDTAARSPTVDMDYHPSPVQSPLTISKRIVFEKWIPTVLQRLFLICVESRFIEYYRLSNIILFFEIKTNNLFTGGLG